MSIINDYKNGLIGAPIDIAAREQFLSENPMGLYGDHSSETKDTGKGKIALPYRNVLKFDPEFGAYEAQDTGDCFLAGTSVKMSDGSEKNIEDVKIGDFVLSPTGQIRKVINLIKKKPSFGKVRKITLKSYFNEIYCTPDHLILVHSEDGLIWKKSEEITDLDSLVIPKQKNLSQNKIFDFATITDFYTETTATVKRGRKHLKRFVELDSSIGWLIGIYCAEGGISENTRVDFSLNINEEFTIAKKIELVIENKFGIKCRKSYRKDKNVIVISCDSKLFTDFIKQFSPGNCYSKKLINTNIFNDLTKLEIIRGWIDGDGSFNKNRTRLNGSSVSKDLIYSMSKIMQELEIQHSCRIRKPIGRSKQSYEANVYSGEALKIFTDCLVKRANPKNMPIKQQKINKCKLGLLASVKTNETIPYTDDVYCIEVEDEHAFIANGIAVHNCTSHGARNAGMITVCSDIVQKKQPELFLGRIATEPIYGYRGHSGGGMNPTRAARFVSTVSGLHIRKDYGIVNLSRYNAQIGINWGARGVPANVIEVGKEAHIETVSLVRTPEEARDLLYNGYGLTIASSFGFANKRDKNGIARRSGSWNHQMSIIAMDDTKQRSSECLFLIQNSWGPHWISGPKFPEDQPEGSFWITATILHGMIRDGESWVFSGAKGFPSKDLDWSLYDQIF